MKTLQDFLITILVLTNFYSKANSEPANPTSLSPDAVGTSSNVSYAPPLFPGETGPLTEEYLQQAAKYIQNETISNLFSFGHRAKNISHSQGPPQDCKVLPGDSLWPSDRVWEIFNYLSNNSLVIPQPLAASCYPDWPDYDNITCTAITAQWTNSDLQYVSFRASKIADY